VERGEGNQEEAAQGNAQQAQQNIQAAESGVESGPEPVASVNGKEGAAAEQQPDLAAQYLDALQRERASFINYKRRVEQERAESAQYATAALLKKLLTVVDDFDRALQSIPEEERKNNRWLEGIELIARKLHTILEQEGVQPIEALGQPFDPNLHEAVAFEEGADGTGEDRTDTISEVFTKGYRLHDRVLRPAMVKVTRA
jgi:molecular chaperone GrpE